MKKYLILFIIVLWSVHITAQVTRTARGKSQSTTYQVDNNADDIGTALRSGSTIGIKQNVFDLVSYHDDFADALIDIGSTKVTLRVAETVSITTNTTITKNIAVEMSRPGLFSITAGDTLTFADSVSFSAGLWQCFSGDGVVKFGENSVDVIYPEWFGAHANGTTDNTSFINKAITSLPSNGGRIKATNGVYLFGSSIKMKDYVTISGNGANATQFKMTANDELFEFGNGSDSSASFCIVEDMTIIGSNDGDYGIRLNGFGSGTGQKCVENQFNNLRIFQFDSAGVQFTNWAFSNTLTNCIFGGNGYGIDIKDRGNDLSFFACRVNTSLYGGVRMRGPNDGFAISFFGGRIEDNDGFGVEAYGAALGAISFNGVYFEANEGNDINCQVNGLSVTGMCHFVGNNVSATGAIACVSDATIIGNDFSGTQYTYDISIGSGERNLLILGNNHGSTADPAILDNGSVRSLILDNVNTTSRAATGSFHWQNEGDMVLAVENTQIDDDPTRMSGILFKGKDAAPANRGWRIASLLDSTNTPIEFSFWNGSYFPKMVIDSNGNVGIGVATPSYRLDVDGGVRLQDSLIVGSGSLSQRNWFETATGDSVGMVYYNNTAARLDTVYLVQ